MLRFIDEYGAAGGKLLHIGMQLAALACIALSFFVPSPYDFGALVSGSSALLGMAFRHERRRGHIVQTMAAALALLAAVGLLVQGAGRSERVPTAADEPERETELAPSPGGSHPQRTVDRAAAPPELPEAPAREMASPAPVITARGAVSDGTADELKPAKSFGGLELPDLGEGTPFAAVAMTEGEMKLFEQLYQDFFAQQKSLMQQLSAGEIQYETYRDELVRLGDEVMAELQAAMGPERVEILTEELGRYYSRLAMNPNKVEDKEAWKASDAFGAVEHLADGHPRPPASDTD
jgi:hypothetical protein